MTTCVKIASPNCPTYTLSVFSILIPFAIQYCSPFASLKCFTMDGILGIPALLYSTSQQIFSQKDSLLYRIMHLKTCFFCEGESLILRTPTESFYHCSTISGLSKIPIRSLIILSLGKLQELGICYLKIGLYT